MQIKIERLNKEEAKVQIIINEDFAISREEQQAFVAEIEAKEKELIDIIRKYRI